MDLQVLLNSEIFAWLILPIFIFAARIIDVSIGTLRIIYVAKGMKYFAMICGFFEVLIWLLAITQIMRHLTNFAIYIAYAAGFAVGNYIGIMIEGKLAVGFAAVHIITQKDARELVEHLKTKDFGITSIAAKGMKGNVRLIFMIVKRKDLRETIDIIKRFNPKAFYSIEEVKSVSAVYLPPRARGNLTSIFNMRKRK